MADLKVIQGSFGIDKDAEAYHEATIKFLEDALERAKREKVTFALVVMNTGDNGIMSGWSECGKIRAHATMGALEDVKLRFRDQNIEQ